MAPSQSFFYLSQSGSCPHIPWPISAGHLIFCAARSEPNNMNDFEWPWDVCQEERAREKGGGGESSRGGKQKASETKTNGSRLPARRPQWKRYSVSAETDLFMPLCCVRRAEPDINCLCLWGGGGDVEFHTRKHTVQKETWGTETVPLVCQSSPQENENFILFLAESFTPD